MLTENQLLMEKHQAVACTLFTAYENHMASLPVDGAYDLVEELGSGKMLNHLRGVSLDELKNYIRNTFIHSSPPCFHIRMTYTPPVKPKRRWFRFNQEVKDD